MDKKVSNTSVSEGELKILKLFTTAPDEDFHFREAARMLDVTHRTVRNNVEPLYEKNLLKINDEGRNRVFRLNFNNDMLPYYLSLAELDRTVNYLEQHDEIALAWQKAGESILDTAGDSVGTVVLFGSHAKEVATEESDLDIFVSYTGKNTMDAVREAFKDAENIYGFSTDLTFVENPRNNIAHSNIHPSFQEIIDAHIILFGVERFVNIVWRFHQ